MLITSCNPIPNEDNTYLNDKTIETSQPPTNELSNNQKEVLEFNNKTALNELQTTVCESAYKNNKCNQSEELRLVTIDECCKEMKLCCTN